MTNTCCSCCYPAYRANHYISLNDPGESQPVVQAPKAPQEFQRMDQSRIDRQLECLYPKCIWKPCTFAICVCSPTACALGTQAISRAVKPALFFSPKVSASIAVGCMVIELCYVTSAIIHQKREFRIEKITRQQMSVCERRIEEIISFFLERKILPKTIYQTILDYDDNLQRVEFIAAPARRQVGNTVKKS